MDSPIIIYYIKSEVLWIFFIETNYTANKYTGSVIKNGKLTLWLNSMNIYLGRFANTTRSENCCERFWKKEENDYGEESELTPLLESVSGSLNNISTS